MRRTSFRARRALIQLTPVIVIAALVGVAATDSGGSGEHAQTRDGLSGTVSLDGAQAMSDILDRAAERFHHRHPGVRVTVGASGDQSGAALFCAGEVDIAAIARPLDRAERRQCRTSGIRYAPVEVAREGIALVVSDRNRFAGCLALGQVKSIWRHGSPATSWAAVDRAYPAIPLEPVGSSPDTPPATLLAEALFGPVDPLLRIDYDVPDDTKDLLKAVASSPGAIGFLPVTQIGRARGVRALAVDGKRGCVAPAVATVRDGSYRVLSRRLYLDVNIGGLREPETRRFMREYLHNPPPIRASDGVLTLPRLHPVYRKFTRP